MYWYLLLKYVHQKFPFCGAGHAGVFEGVPGLKGRQAGAVPVGMEVALWQSCERIPSWHPVWL